MQKEQNDRCNRYTGDDQCRQCTSGNFTCLTFFAGTHFEIIVGCAADPEEQCGSSGNRCDRKCDVCCSVSEHSNTLSDKNLIDNIIKSVDQHTDDRRDCKFGEETADWRNSQGIVRV